MLNIRDRLIGFESARAVIMENGKRLAELSPGELLKKQAKNM
ncbi:hypothetical protein [Lebetimonas sp. JH292]|nr:hypothetical protein [Lebetimonas sp. JH292]